ncbi:MAG: BatD family protein [Hydrogenophilaceae bacterium]|nr:BatD family protein [Hydrogenophilaceae bacterium]
MVRLALACLALSVSHAALALNAQLDRKHVALGEPLTLSISGKAASLEQLDLAPLKAEFEVFARTLSRSDAQGILQLTLYPLKSGRLAIPALGSGRDRSRALPVQVNTSSEFMPAVSLKLYTEPAQPFVRQPTRLTLEICDDGSLDWKRPALPLTSLAQHRALGEEQIEIEQEGMRCTAHRYHWAVLPTQAGEIRLVLPALEAGKFGQRLRLPPPPAVFSAAAVPAWLPLNVPVGKPMVSAETLPGESPLQRPLVWRFSVDGGYSIDGLKALLALHLQPHREWNAYPPTVETLAPEDRNSPLNRLAVTLYALPESAGPLALPALTLPYFDPATARLEKIALPAQQVRVIDPLWRKLGYLAALLAGSAALLVLLNLLHKEMLWRRARRRILLAIRNAADPAELGRTLRGFSFVQNEKPAATLGQWLERIGRQARTSTAMAELVAALEARRYGLHFIALADLQAQAMTAISGLRPRCRLSWRQQ